MKKKLKNTPSLYYFEGGTLIKGANPNMSGDCSGLSGDCTLLSGNCSGLWGDCAKLMGDCTGLTGDCTGLWGDLDKCGITEEDREKGINIEDLIEKGE